MNLEVQGEDHSAVTSNEKIQLAEERLAGQGGMFQR